MSVRWVTIPPAPCHATGNDEERRGPYAVETMLIAEVIAGPRGPQVTPRIRPLVHGASWIKAICDAPGSPYRALETGEYEAMQADLERLRAERDDLARRLEEAKAPEVVVSPVDEQALASALIVSLEGHFARKAGRKPREPSAA